MMREAETWAEVEAVTAKMPVCIREGGGNHEKAKETWENLWPANVRYFLKDANLAGEPTGAYARLLRVSRSHYQSATWVVDYAAQFDMDDIIEVARRLENGVLLVKTWVPGHEHGWSKLTLGFPCLSEVPYSLTKASESQWYVVVPPTETWKERDN